MDEPGLKLRTARTLKWNSIDRFSSQVLYGVVGIVLANLLSKSDFGLVGAILVFQSFAVIFVDSGFGAALLQKKNPTEEDYDTVFWFNLTVAVIVYLLLWLFSPMISEIFHSDELTDMSRVMFLSFIFTALGIVQTNRLMKRMEVRQIAVANIVGQTLSGALAIYLSLEGYGAWALVWQAIALSLIKTGWLWLVVRWRPRVRFSFASLRGIAGVGAGVFVTSLLNTICLNIYNFIIGFYYRLSALGVYTQADKWSKMGSASLSQIYTATFVPLLSKFQDKTGEFCAMVGKVNRMVAFLTFPFMGALIILAEPIFHLLFGTKWDEAVPLFQILVGRGILVVLISLYSNYILSLGKSKLLVAVEVVKDILIVAAIFVTLPLGSIEALVWGQFYASLATFLLSLVIMCRASGYRWWRILTDNLPYMLLTAVCMGLAALISVWLTHPSLVISVGLVVAGLVYYGVLALLGSVVLRDAKTYLFGRFSRRK